MSSLVVLRLGSRVRPAKREIPSPAAQGRLFAPVKSAVLR
jgi:hypothetical protein